MTRYPAVQAGFGWAFTLENRRIPTNDVSMCQVLLRNGSVSDGKRQLSQAGQE